MTQRKKRKLFGRSVHLDIVAANERERRSNMEIPYADDGIVPCSLSCRHVGLAHAQKRCGLLAVPATDSIFIIERDMHSKTAPPCTVRWYFDGEDLPFDDGCTILYLNSACHSDDTS